MIWIECGNKEGRMDVNNSAKNYSPIPQQPRDLPIREDRQPPRHGLRYNVTLLLVPRGGNRFAAYVQRELDADASSINRLAGIVTFHSGQRPPEYNMRSATVRRHLEQRPTNSSS